MAYSIEIKNEAVSRVRNGETVNDVSKDLSVSAASIYRWLKDEKMPEPKEKEDVKEEVKEIFEKESELIIEDDVLVSRIIKDLTIRKKYNEALKICNEKRFEVNPIIQCQKIKILIKLKKLDQALSLCFKKEFLNHLPIQTQKIQILILQDRLEEALHLCDYPKYKNELAVLSQKVAILSKMNRKMEAMKICEREDALNFAYIQSQRIDLLIEQKRYEEALEIANYSKFDNVFAIQSQKVSILVSMKRYEEALEICNRSRLERYSVVQNQKLKILIDIGRYEEALEFLKNIDSNDYKFLSLKVKLYINLGKNDEALEICNNPRLNDLEVFQSQKLTILLNTNQLDEALKICNRSCFKDSKSIQSQKISLFIKLGRYEEALEICNREEFKDSDSIQKYRSIILLEQKGIETGIEKVKLNEIEIDCISDGNKTENILSSLLTRIYCDDISLEELDNEKVDSWELFVLKVAFYEKNNKNNGLLFIKSKQVEFTDEDKQKVIRKLTERLKMKKSLLFDYYVYGKTLDCPFDFDLQKEIMEKRKFQEENEKLELKRKEKEKLEKEKQRLEKEQLLEKMRLSLPQRSRIVSNLEIKEPVKEITVPVSFHLEKEESKVQIERSKVKEKETRTVTIRSVYRKELEEFGKYLYLRMSDLSARSHAIRVWDNLECLIDNSVDNEIALKKVEDVLIRTGYLTQESIDVKVKKISK